MVRVQQVLPLGSDLEEMVAHGNDPVPEGWLEVDWPLLAVRSATWPKGSFEIEPGETDEVSWDFFLEGDLWTLLVYSYFTNVQKRRKDIGWGLTTVYDLEDAAERSVEKTVGHLTGKGH